MTIVIKIVTPSSRSSTENEVTRWTVKGEWNDDVWNELLRKLQKVFQTRATGFHVSWFDGEDYCTIRDWSDLQEAVECMQSMEGGAKGCRIYASPDKKEHHTIFGTKPQDDSDDVKGTDKKGQEEAQPPTQEETEPIPTSQWELLNLDSEESEANNKAEVDSDTKEEKEDEREQSAPVPVPVEAAPSAAVPAVAAAAVVASVAKEVPAEPVATGAVPAAINATPNPATFNIAAGQPNPYMAGIPAQFMAPYFSVTGGPGVPPMYPPQWAGSPAVYSAMDLNGPQAAVPTAPLAPSMCPLPTVPNEPPVASAPVPAKPRVSSVPPTTEEKEPTTKKEGHKKEKTLKGPAMAMCLQTLRSMGYSQDDKQLKRLVRKHGGNLNAILDDPSLTVGN